MHPDIIIKAPANKYIVQQMNLREKRHKIGGLNLIEINSTALEIKKGYQG